MNTATTNQTVEETYELGLPSPLPRKHPLNRCVCCEKFGTADNPVTTYPGLPPDLENGPSKFDLPMTICDICSRDQCRCDTGVDGG